MRRGSNSSRKDPVVVWEEENLYLSVKERVHIHWKKTDGILRYSQEKF